MQGGELLVSPPVVVSRHNTPIDNLSIPNYPSAEALLVTHVGSVPIEWIATLPDDSTAEHRARIEAFIKAQSNVFCSSEYDIGRTSILPHCTDTCNSAPHFEQLRHHPTMWLLLIDENMANMLRYDVIEPTASSRCSNVVRVCKRDGIMQFCVKYRNTNERIKKDKFP